ncbi:alpha/beta fold hydrolase [Histidinibacterium aquaticum]|uniref:Alpha/beta fold hydrolase n=1 Tax=Histidinibacterium aquaticum TaxID=2613962 RepID=A0A5J5GKZ1_9RHOB|nr:alpha/beta fold hydrolase [Histidinibacterium aquaticum]KAA9008323.1 alpha/beta fold hydrolase [Histidinibacterium aquaticum]
MKLRTDVYGEGQPRKLLLAHGLFGQARNFRTLAKSLSDTFEVTVPDMRNHGGSPWAETHGYEEMAEDLAPLAGGAVLGHSMGGKAAMMLALTRPERVEQLIVADIAPVDYGGETHPQLEAMARLDPDQPSRTAARDALEVEEHLKDFLVQSLDLKEKRWTINLDTLRAEMTGIFGWPEIEATYEGPTLFLTGGESDYVRPEHREAIKALFPHARFAKIPGAGHFLHAEKPEAFEGTVRAFLGA